MTAIAKNYRAHDLCRSLSLHQSSPFYLLVVVFRELINLLFPSYFEVFAYVGLPQNLKDLKDQSPKYRTFLPTGYVKGVSLGHVGRN